MKGCFTVFPGYPEKKRKAHPPESPLNGGINQIILLLGGVLHRSGEGALIFGMVILRK
jgi:hypothetical protein